jgi:hypothetical protein
MPFRAGPAGREDLQLALDVSTLIAEHELRRNPGLPMLYKSGVRYAMDVCLAGHVPGACERFLSPLQGLAEVRSGKIAGLDCDDLGPWRAAECRVRLGDRRARAYPITSPGIGWHILVRRGDGTIEDPSRRLGMKV